MQMPLLHRISANVYIQSVREAFICLIPYLILISALTLIISIIQALTLIPEGSAVLETLISVNRSTYLLFPLATMLALSFTLGKNLEQPPVACAILALACFISLNNELIEIERIIDGGYYSIQPYSMLLPFIVVLTLKTTRKKITYKYIQAPSISSHLQLHINLIAPYILSFAVICSVLLVLTPILTELFQPVAEALQGSNLFVRGLIKTISSSLLWFLGIHGDNTYNLIADPWLNGEVIGENIIMARLQDFFMLMGGTGNGLSLIIAILLFSKDERSLKISKISLPFSIFNINELLIFGLPVVFNPYLLIPFVLVPTILYCCAYTAVSFGLVSFIPHDISWITPPIINTYLAGADLNACILQVILLILGISIYAPFVRMSHFYNHDKEVAQKLASKLSLDNFTTKIQQPEPEKGSAILATSLDDSGLLEEIMAGQLYLEYQPIICQKNFSITAFEVFINLRCSDSTLLGPEFLNELSSPSVIEIIQLWQMKELKKDFQKWERETNLPNIYIGMNNATLNHPRLIKTFSVELIHFREKVHLALSREAFHNNLQLLTNMAHILDTGITVSLCDKESESLPINVLSHDQVEELCLDANRLTYNQQHKQPNLFKSLTNFSHSIGNKVRVSRIDKEEYLQRSEIIEADFLQGTSIAPKQKSDDLLAFTQVWDSNAKVHKENFDRKKKA